MNCPLCDKEVESPIALISHCSWGHDLFTYSKHRMRCACGEPTEDGIDTSCTSFEEDYEGAIRHCEQNGGVEQHIRDIAVLKALSEMHGSL